MAAGRNSPRRGWTEQHPSRRRRLWAAAAAVGTVVAQMGRRSVAELASPALAVKAGRNRGPSVLERQQNDANERQQEAAAAKATRTATKPKRVESAVEVIDATLPNGVGILGRGRARANKPLTCDGTTVEALQRLREALLAKAEFRGLHAVSSIAPAGATTRGVCVCVCMCVCACVRVCACVQVSEG